MYHNSNFFGPTTTFLMILPDDAPFDPDDGQVNTKGLLRELESKWKPIFEKLDDGKSGKTFPAIRLKDLR